MEGSEKNTNKKTTIKWWQTPLGRTLPSRKWPRVCRAIKLTHVVYRTQALCNKRALGMSLRARRVLDACIIHFGAVGRIRFLILAPLSNPGIKSRIREKIPGGQHFMTITLHGLYGLFDSNWISNLHGTRLKPRMRGAASVSMCFFYMCCHFTTRKPEESQDRQSSWKITFEFTSKHDTSVAQQWQEPVRREAGATRLPNFSPPKEEMNGEEVWQMRRLKHILIHTAKDRISEDVAGIVVFASVSSRSMDRDPIWTPCDRSCYGTFQIWPRHLAKLHAPRKTRKTS